MKAIKTIIRYKIISFLLLFHISSYALPLYLDTYTNEQGLSQNSITCSTTDEKGFHWFATQGGLNRFDGYEFKHYKFNPSHPSISGNWITDCLNLGNGHIWFATTSNGLNLLNTETGSFSVFNQYSTPPITNERISSISSNSPQIIWIGHDKGQLTRLDTYTGTTELFSYQGTNHLNVVFKDVLFDDQKNLWLASSIGLIKFDTQTHQFEHIPNSPEQLWQLKKAENGKFIIGGKTGLSVFDSNTLAFYNFEQLKNVWVTDILFDDEKKLWVSTYGHGLYYQATDNLLSSEFHQLTHSPDLKHGLANDHLLSLYQDPQGIIWIGTDGYGLHRYDKRQAQFGHQKHQSNNPASISNDFVRAILKDSKNLLWVGTRDGLNKQTDTGFKRYKTDKNQDIGLTNNNIFSLYEDANKRVWIGTYGGGLLLYNPINDNFSAFTVQSHQLSSNRIYAIEGDLSGNLWLGSNEGLTRFNPDTSQVTNFKYTADKNSISNNTVFSITYDSDNNAIWAGTRAGLNKLSLHDETFTHYQSDLKKPNSLTHDMVTSLHLQDKNTLWVGTFGGLNKLNIQTNKVINITEFDGLLNDNIFAIKQDSSGYLWLSSNQGLTRYAPQTQQMQHFLPANGIQHHSFILGAAFQADDGELFFGGINGFNQFDPLKLTLATQPPEPVITDLLIYNQSVATQQYIKNKTQTAKLISYTDRLFFKEEDGVIGFKFSALNSAEPPSQYQYAYKLAGLDKQFLYANKNQRQVSYSQLPAGSYHFIVKVKDQYGQWSDDKTMVALKVTPPWWKNNVAYVTYIMIVLFIMWLIITARYRANVAEQANLKEKELSNLKTQLLDNVSHELKTPLSLILAPLESLQKSHKDSDTQQKLAMIQRNSYKLLDQINQLLQLSQRPSTAVKHVTPYAIKPVVEQLIEDFTPLFKQKNITFEFEDLTQKTIPIKLELNHTISIISNLLSNAQKYTPNTGKVLLQLLTQKQTLIITVSDTGVGIDKEHLETIFQRFTRIDTSNQSGSGIGLALVKQLVEQYGGTIELKSELNKGSCFTVSLPTTQIDETSNLTALAVSKNNNLCAVKSNKILIIEDNDEMRDLITSLFISSFTCISAANGELGLALCKNEMPDLVISDVMMPVMDGYQFIKALRSDTAISHIPVLLLSAKADTHSKLKGLDLLADDYLSKPFEPQLLLSRVQGLLTIREVLNQHLKQQLPALSQTAQLDPQMAQSKDYVFTERVKTTVKEHYQDEAFSVEEFAASLYLSPRALQLKMKALYNLTPSDYIRNIRLEFAQELLKNSELAIGLVAQQVGFNSQSYFARCFKAKYNMSPKQFREQS
ncbi:MULTISPECIES: hybrid sensor histidine kinase/response regulator transcription factor [Pseudoalteromonas]|uniref:hybrid sensor histidine kinase/response regulator transcription factor n=1 Tax=Pseudoalteromonas TaxID=53246 RepID=UPI000C32A95D|nr:MULTISPECIES: hybrid sensor histidine kinase/response regulator transcription factor [Pseudoalteromonas]PKG64464.1 hybrid sensor histidine kinase/response regulator [Pseudoalteromonas arctica]PKG70764.1 hybrid sensor histidine kinase/response regulator [Pseudoalteromonas sp. GutCa3]